MNNRQFFLALCLLVCWFAGPQVARADAEARQPDDSSKAVDSKPAKPYKLTMGYYRYDSAPSGSDLNLRYRGQAATGWVGLYHDRDFGPQWRGGLEQSFNLIADLPLSLQFSGQIASRGFLGGSVTLEYGEPWFVSFGVGRTNNRPYFNLNFDPNDAISMAFGWRGDNGLTAYVFAVRDNRFNPGQQNLHTVLRLPLGNQQRLGIDLQRKSGLTSAEQGAGGQASANQGKDWALTLTWDWRDWSIRLADDRKQNFSDVNAVRLSLAYRF